MKNYNRIKIEKMADTNYLKQLFDEQKIIVQILVDEQTCEIVELVSYGLDKDAKSYCKYLVRDNDELCEKIIIETLYPFYNYKQKNVILDLPPLILIVMTKTSVINGV